MESPVTAKSKSLEVSPPLNSGHFTLMARPFILSPLLTLDHLSLLSSTEVFHLRMIVVALGLHVVKYMSVHALREGHGKYGLIRGSIFMRKGR